MRNPDELAPYASVSSDNGGGIGCFFAPANFNERGSGWEQTRACGSSVYRDGLKSGPVLLSNNQARPGRNFSQPRVHNKVHLCRL